MVQCNENKAGFFLQEFDEDNETLKSKIAKLDPLEFLWQGIPFVYKLTSTLFGTIKPEQMNNKVYNKLTVFQTSQNGKEIKRVASIPV